MNHAWPAHGAKCFYYGSSPPRWDFHTTSLHPHHGTEEKISDLAQGKEREKINNNPYFRHAVSREFHRDTPKELLLPIHLEG